MWQALGGVWRAAGTAARAGVLAAGLAVAAPSASAADQPVDLELVLAVDVSGSVDDDEALLQRSGYVGAFRHPEVIDAIAKGFLGRIAVAYMEWAGEAHQKLLVDWTVIDGADGANRFADRLAGATVRTAAWTSISGAIGFSMTLFERNGFEGTRRVIDISGDGANNAGPPVTALRDAAVAEGLIINGLPIVNRRPSRFGLPQEPALDQFYIHCVIGGPGAFIVTADDFHSFAVAVRRKLVLEIAGLAPPRPLLHRAQAAGGYAHGCDIGERRLQQFLRNREF